MVLVAEQSKKQTAELTKKKNGSGRCADFRCDFEWIQCKD